MLRFVVSTSLLLASCASVSAQTSFGNPSFELGFQSLQRNSATPLVFTGDFNSDGKPDVIVQGGQGPVGATGSQNSEYGISLVLGNGDGTFQAPVVVGTADSFINDMVVADLNHDGNLDVITFDMSNTVDIFYGNGSGQFEQAVVIATKAAPLSGAAGIFFNDGYTDLAFADANGAVELYKNSGGRSFALQATIPNVAAGSTITRLRAGNVNGNTYSDLGVMTRAGASLLFNDGTGNFTQAQLSTYADPVDLSFADVNQDGRADAIVSYSCGQSEPQGPAKGNFSDCAGIDVYYGMGAGKTYFRNVVKDQGPNAMWNVTAADINGDGVADLVASGSTSGGTADGLYVWMGNSSDVFSATPTIFNVGQNGGLAAGDFTRSGHMSFVEYTGEDLLTFINANILEGCQASTISMTVTVCKPVNEAYIPSNYTVEVEANAYDTAQVTAMQEYIDGNLVYNKPVSAMDELFPATLQVGAHSLVTKAWDANGADFMSPRTIHIYDGTPHDSCPAAPTVQGGFAAICYPYDDETSHDVYVLANGWTAHIPTAVQLYVDGNLVVNNTTPGVSYIDTTITMASGSHNLVFKLWDDQGNVYTASETHTVN